jgi:biopolymer transport protein TolR
MAFGGNQKHLMSEINVTPLVDVMLVLLIIFMVTAPMMMQGVDVDLPETTDKQLSAKENHLIVSIDAKSRIFISDVEVTMGSLGKKLKKIVEARQNKEVYLKADENIPYGIVVKVMSAIKGAGISNLGMVTEPVKEEK